MDADKSGGGIGVAVLVALTGSLRVLHNVNGGRLGSWSTWRALASLVVPSGRAEAEGGAAFWLSLPGSPTPPDSSREVPAEDDAVTTG